MAVVEIRKPFEVFNDTNGNPLEGGFVYIGVSGSEAQSTPKAVYWDSGLTIPASQPLRTRNGFVVNSNTGNPAPYYTDGSYSMTIKDEQGITVSTRLVNGDGAVTLGTMATQNAGTAGTEFRNNTENDARFLLQSAYVPATAGLSGVPRVINGDFAIRQRGATSGSAQGGTDIFTATLAGVGTTVDRFSVVSSLAASASSPWQITPNSNVIGNSVPSGFLSVTSGAQVASDSFSALATKIESVRSYGGQVFTIFGWFRRATPGNIAVYALQDFGTGGGGSPAVETYVGQLSLTTAFTPQRITVSLPSVAGKTVGAANNDNIMLVFFLSGGSSYNSKTGSLGLQNTTVDFYGIHDRLGDLPIEAINFYQPPDPQTELARCQRYFAVLDTPMKISAAAPQIGQTALPVTMRAAPTLSNITFSAGTGATFSASKTNIIQTNLHSQAANVTSITASAEL